jgi:hypothetical protein
MSERSLRGVLAELHETLEGARDLDPSSRAALREAAEEIRDALDRAEARDERAELSEGVSSRLSEALGRFEESHPSLTEVLRRLVDQLSDLGI